MMPTLPPTLCYDESIDHAGPSHPAVHAADLHRFGCSICFMYSVNYPLLSSHLLKCEGPFLFVGSIKEEHFNSDGPFSIGAYAEAAKAFKSGHGHESNDVYWHLSADAPRSFGFSDNEDGEDKNEDTESDYDDHWLSWPIDQSGNHQHSCHNGDNEFRTIYNCPGKL